MVKGVLKNSFQPAEIPIAFIFGATQLTTGSLLKAIMIIAGMVIFSIFISMFLKTHSKVLAILNKDIEKKKSFFEKENPSFFMTFQDKIISIEELSKSIAIRIFVTHIITWILVFIAIAIAICIFIDK